jgi:chitin synthase
MQGLNVPYILEQIFLTIYGCGLIIIFICSMGNRPQGFRIMYAAAMVVFGVVMAIMFIMACIAIDRGYASSGKDPSKAQTLTFGILSTYGIYFMSSFAYGDPWHMFTSFPQYLVLIPSYTNILTLYAFCNTHDVSWGTKGDNTQTKDSLPAHSVKKEDAPKVVEVEVMDIHAKEENQDGVQMTAYAALLQEFRDRPEKEHVSRDSKTKIDDGYRMFRSLFVLGWFLSNFLLVVIVTSNASKQQLGAFNPYMLFLVYVMLCFSFFRLGGSTFYLFLEYFNYYKKKWSVIASHRDGTFQKVDYFLPDGFN